jgi:hypothetical protein
VLTKIGDDRKFLNDKEEAEREVEGEREWKK